MWLLESDGDLFGGRRIWLRPGQTWLFGRTSSNPAGHRGFAISHKGVSRKHLTVNLAAVSEGSGGRVNEKSRLTITDDSKFGTTLDNDKFAKDTRLLDRKEHTIRLGSYDQLLKFTWHNVVLTVTSTKSIALKSHRVRLEPFDIKIVTDFVLSSTTHVLAAKRNLPKVLQGILGAKYIVTEAYVDAVVRACTSVGRDDGEDAPLPGPLEENFDAAWPDPMDFVPDSSNEPVPREARFFAPDPERTALFEGFIFAFCDAQQQSSLEPALSLGGAKCPLCPVELGVTSAQEVTKFIRKIAGKKSDQSLSDDSPKGVVVVRLQTKTDDTPEIVDWTTNFIQSVDRDLEQRSIEQREFLDAILTKDTSSLKRGLRYEDESGPPASSFEKHSGQGPHTRSEPPRARNLLSSRGSASQDVPPRQPGMPDRSQTSQLAESEAPSQSSPAKPTRLRTRRAGTQPKPKFKGFDNFEDDAPPAPPPQSDPMDADDEPPSNQAAPGATQDRHMALGNAAETANSQSLFLSQDQPATSTRSKKRAEPPADSDGEPLDPNQAMELLLPGSRALKRRRLAEGTPAPAATTSVGASSDDDAASKSRVNGRAKGKAKKVVSEQADLRQRAKERAQAMDKVKQEDQQEDDDDDVTKLRDLAIVEEMDVPRMHSSYDANYNDDNDDDNDNEPARCSKPSKPKPARAAGNKQRKPPEDPPPDPYAGRKNFKRFRRKGTTNTTEKAQYNRGTRVIVPLEEVAHRDYGIGEHYWSFPSSASSKKKKTQSQSQRRVADTVPDEENDGGALPSVDAMAQQEREDVEADERERERLRHVAQEELAGPQREGWTQRVREGRKEGSGARESQAQTQTQKGKKRPAGAKAVEPSPKRRQTTLGRGARPAWGMEEDEEEEDDDELAFKLRR